VSHDPTTKKATPNPDVTYMTTIEDESSDAKDNAVSSLAEDKRWTSAVAQPPDTTEEDQVKKTSFSRVLSVLSVALVAAALLAFLTGPSWAQSSGTISFGKSTLQGETSDRPTSLQFGPDGRLYVAQQDGLIKAYTVARNGANSYSVTATETISSIKSIPNHNDDGVRNTNVIKRQVLGILVRGTASNPVIYASSSDPRIGAGANGEGDVNLDTNSGIVSRLTKNGPSWDKVDLVRGLPRSEENHATNGMQLDESTNTLYLAVGSSTNHGAPSNNFALLPEYALSTAVLSIDLGTIGNTTYDLPTLDDEDRAGSADANDPFGGNDGKNQAKVVSGGPVQVYASGFRNPYDVLLTKSGKLYTVDNSGNAGWGDVPKNEGPGGTCTNEQNEPGTTDADTLHLVSSGYYGGHPNPTRGNKSNKFNSSNPQSPVPTANPVECDYRAPGSGSGQKGDLTSFNESTNGLAEYTASKFDGAMKGDLLAAGFNKNNIYRIKLNSEGNAVTSKEVLFSTVTPDGKSLDVTAQGDSDPFPGTIWVADVIGGGIVAFEPADSSGESCTGADDPALDEDEDGFDNADEIDNTTNPCSAADVPADSDGDKNSDLNDPDDDNDSSPDTSDPFAVDKDNGKTTNLPVSYTWDNDASNPGGLLNLGFTGLMTNKSADYKSLYDPDNMTAGGAAGATTVDKVPDGDAYTTKNSQKYGFQFGVNATSTTGKFTAHTRIKAPFSGITPTNSQSMGLFIGNGDQDNYAKVVTNANSGAGGIQFAKEIAGSFSTQRKATVAMPGPEAVDLYLTVDPAANTVQPSYSVITNGEAGPRTNMGTPTPIPASWFGGTSGLAVGIISTSAGPGPEFPATWDLIEVVPEEVEPPVDEAPEVKKAPTQTLLTGSALSSTSTIPVKLNWSATDAEGAVAGYELQQSTDGGPWTDVTLSSPMATTVTRNLEAGKTYQFQVRAQDGAGNWSDWKQEQSFKVNVLQETDGTVSYTGTWGTQSLSSASGGSLRYASASGDTAKLTLGSDALNVAWVAPKGKDRGKAEAWVDGVKAKDIDLYVSGAQSRKTVFTKNGLSASQPHTIEVRVLGQKNAASSGTRADVDAFVVLSSATP